MLHIQSAVKTGLISPEELGTLLGVNLSFSQFDIPVVFDRHGQASTTKVMVPTTVSIPETKIGGITLTYYETAPPSQKDGLKGSAPRHIVLDRFSNAFTNKEICAYLCIWPGNEKSEFYQSGKSYYSTFIPPDPAVAAKLIEYHFEALQKVMSATGLELELLAYGISAGTVSEIPNSIIALGEQQRRLQLSQRYESDKDAFCKQLSDPATMTKGKLRKLIAENSLVVGRQGDYKTYSIAGTHIASVRIDVPEIPELLRLYDVDASVKEAIERQFKVESASAATSKDAFDPAKTAVVAITEPEIAEFLAEVKTAGTGKAAKRYVIRDKSQVLLPPQADGESDVEWAKRALHKITQ